jgi:hypothetical protein
MDWKHLVCLWLEDQGYSYLQERRSPIHVLSREYRLDNLYDVYIVNTKGRNWLEGLKKGTRPLPPDDEVDVYVLDAKSGGKWNQNRGGYNVSITTQRPGEHPDSWRYHVGDIGNPRFFTRLTLGMNKMRIKDDGARRCA